MYNHKLCTGSCSKTITTLKLTDQSYRGKEAVTFICTNHYYAKNINQIQIYNFNGEQPSKKIYITHIKQMHTLYLFLKSVLN